MNGAGVRVLLPSLLRDMIGASGEITVDVPAPVTQASLIDVIEARYPMLRGTIRDHGTLKRRPFIRLFACQEDLSFALAEATLPEEVVRGAEPLLIVGAMAGG